MEAISSNIFYEQSFWIYWQYISSLKCNSRHAHVSTTCWFIFLLKWVIFRPLQHFLGPLFPISSSDPYHLCSDSYYINWDLVAHLQTALDFSRIGFIFGSNLTLSNKIETLIQQTVYLLTKSNDVYRFKNKKFKVLFKNLRAAD